MIDDPLTKRTVNIVSPINENKSTTIHLKQVSEDEDEDEDEDEKEVVSTAITHSADFFRWTHGHRRVMLTFVTIGIFAFMTVSWICMPSFFLQYLRVRLLE